MAREVDIDYALSETLKQHPDFVSYLSNIIYKNIYSGTNPTNFTSRVREGISSVSQIDFVNYILGEAITIYNAAGLLAEDIETNVDVDNTSKHFPLFRHIQKAIELLKDKNNNTIIYYLYNRTELFELIEAVSQTIFKRQWYLPGNLEKDTRNAFHRQLATLADKDRTTKTLRRMLNIETKAVRGIKNLEINYSAINKCQREILLGSQVRNAHNSYALGSSLVASQDIGKKRANQEDSVLILEHEENPNFKIMAVADGMGGHEHGEVASNYAVARIAEWFNMLSSEFYEYPEQLQMAFSNELMKISKEIYNKMGSTKDNTVGGTTFTGAIVTKDKTIICSVGDSRAYTLKDFDLHLVTEDESAVWMDLRDAKKGEPITNNDLDDLRFAEHNNYITRCLGQKNLGYVQSHIVRNEDYDQLLLFSDGITDILSSDDIKFISATTSPEEIAEVFVYYANTHGVTEKLRGSDREVEIISAGKDNASVVAFTRR